MSVIAALVAVLYGLARWGIRLAPTGLAATDVIRHDFTLVRNLLLSRAQAPLYPGLEAAALLSAVVFLGIWFVNTVSLYQRGVASRLFKDKEVPKATRDEEIRQILIAFVVLLVLVVSFAMLAGELSLIGMPRV